MKTYFKLIILVLGITAFSASCDTCKTCKKESEVSVTVCKGGAGDDTYNNAITGYQNAGYTCN
jgi:hypothetical protein